MAAAPYYCLLLLFYFCLLLLLLRLSQVSALALSLLFEGGGKGSERWVRERGEEYPWQYVVVPVPYARAN